MGGSQYSEGDKNFQTTGTAYKVAWHPIPEH